MERLEELYLTKSLQDRIYLKSKLFGYKMNDTKSIRDNVDDFNRLLLDLENIGIKIDDEDKAIILLLNSLPKSYSTFVETLKYARDSLSLNDVQKALRSKEVDTLTESRTHSSGVV